MNHRCFSGPYLNKGRIAELPQFIGPGNCVLVLKEVSLKHACSERAECCRKKGKEEERGEGGREGGRERKEGTVKTGGVILTLGQQEG